jgi:hypothetical protein
MSARWKATGPLRKANVAGTIAFMMNVAILVCMVGCGPKSDLLGVSGEVSLDGTPLKSGSIQLTSVGSENVSATGGRIRDGQYDIPQAQGLLPGKYQVSINAVDENAPPDTSGPGGPVARELIPEEYNVNSQKMVDVTVDGENHFVFDIQTK